MYVISDRDTRRVVRATEVREWLLRPREHAEPQGAGGRLENNTSHSLSLTGQRATRFHLRNSTIEGDLDLSHCRVELPVEFDHCRFTGQVNLCYSEFMQTVRFLNCEFDGHVNGGDRTHTRAVFHKDLVFSKARFRDLVSFNRAYVEGHVWFADSLFERLSSITGRDGKRDWQQVVEGEADFAGMQVERNFICNWSTFDREVSFNALRCRTAELHGTRFLGHQNPVDFRSAYFTGNIEFLDPRVEEEYSKDHRICPKEKRTLPPPTVEGKLNLRGFKCDRRAIFAGVFFGGEVDCEDAVFGWYLDCRAAVFKGRSVFVRTRCDGSAMFDDASFEYAEKGVTAADFRYAKYASLEFSGAVFHGRLALAQTRIEEKLRLDETRCLNDVLLYGAQIGTIVLLNEGHNFQRLLDSLNHLDRRGPSPVLTHLYDIRGLATHLQLKVQEQELARIGYRLSLVPKPEGGEHDEVVQRWLRRQMQRDPRLCNVIADYYFPFKKLEMENKPQGKRNTLWTSFWMSRTTIDPEPSPRGVELHGCTFRRIHAGPVPILADELIRSFVASQKPERFSRDVYLQLEQFYRQTGNDERARQMHLWGHLATRRNAFTDGGAVKWSRAQKSKDFALMLTGWGLQAWKTWILSAFLILTGTLYFSLMDEALRVKSETNVAIGAVLPGTDEVRRRQPAEVPEELAASDVMTSVIVSDCWGEGVGCWLRRAEYSLTAFIPAIELGLDQGWEPATGPSEAARLFLVVSGWLLVPLGVGSITGLIKSD